MILDAIYTVGDRYHRSDRFFCEFRRSPIQLLTRYKIKKKASRLTII
ncbi:MAG: hypothetical protein ACRC1Z_07545 [Waterburya sp.]